MVNFCHFLLSSLGLLQARTEDLIIICDYAEILGSHSVRPRMTEQNKRSFEPLDSPTKKHLHLWEVFFYWRARRDSSCNVAHCFGHSVAIFSLWSLSLPLLKSNLRPSAENNILRLFSYSGSLRSFEPLGFANKKHLSKREAFFNWRARRDSNSQPSDP